MYNGKPSTKTCLGSNKVHAHCFLSTKKKKIWNGRVACERLVKFSEDEEFTTSLRLAHECQPTKGHMRNTC